MRPPRRDIAERSVNAVLFAQSHRHFTAQSLGIELGILPRHARRYIDYLSLYMPIVEIKPARYEFGTPSRLPAEFALMREGK